MMDSLSVHQSVLACPPCADSTRHALRMTGVYATRYRSCGGVSSLFMDKNGRERTAILFITGVHCQIGQNKKKLDSARSETGVNTGVASQRWQQLIKLKA